MIFFSFVDWFVREVLEMTMLAGSAFVEVVLQTVCF